MNIVPIQPEHVEHLYAIYLAQTARAPHCRFVPSLQQFRDDVLQRSEHLRQESQQFDVLVAAADDGTAAGFAALTTYEDEDENEQMVQRQAITGLFVDDEAAAHALIVACEQRHTTDVLFAFPSTHGNTVVQHYNVGWDGLSIYVHGIAGTLAQHGYIPVTRELHLVASLDHARHQPIALPGGIMQDGPKPSTSYPWSTVVRAMDGENRIGLCNFSDLEIVTHAEGAEQVGYIWGLGVDEAYRRRGIARSLMTAAMQHMIDQGCTEYWLTTNHDNWSAQALYHALGCEVVDCSVSFRKRITDR